MKFKEALLLCNFEKVKKDIVRFYPDQDKMLPGYVAVFHKLCSLEPVETKFRICFDIQVEEDGDAWVTVDGADGSLVKDQEDFGKFNIDPNSEYANSEQKFALEFNPWEEWVGMELDKPEYMTLEEAIAHSLYELTFFSFDEDEIQDQSEKLKKQAEWIENCDIEEEIKKGNLIEMNDTFFEDLKKRLEDEESKDGE